MLKRNTALLTLTACALIGTAALFAAPEVGAQRRLSTEPDKEREAREQEAANNRSGGGGSSNVDANTGKILNEAIMLVYGGQTPEGATVPQNLPGAKQKLATLDIEKLSPYEHSRVEQLYFQIAYLEDDYEKARQHLQAAIDAGGLNEQEVSTVRFQSAQLYLAEEKWKEGAAALEEWFKTAVNPNSDAYYLLAAAYYYMEDYDRALPPAKKAVELMTTPNEQWIVFLASLYFAREEYREAIPLVEHLIGLSPNNAGYWGQLSAIYSTLEEYPKALAVKQVAAEAGLVKTDTEVRQLADLQAANELPYRCATTLEEAVKAGVVKGDLVVYEKTANCWIAAAEYDRAIQPLERAAELAPNGELFVRLGQVQVQREEWAAASTALERGINKGELRDVAEAQAMMGIALYNQKKPVEARSWFERASRSEKHRNLARGYINMIDQNL